MPIKSTSSPGQVLQNCYDEPNQALRTTATAVINGNIEVDLDAADGDNVAISDGVNLLAIEPDGSINVNINNIEVDIEVNAADGDTVGISDGTTTAQVTTLGELKTSDSSLLAAINTLNSNLLAQEPLKISGTQDGTSNGPEFLFVNNLKNQILAAHDRNQQITYADFGNKNQRIVQIDYSSPTFPGTVARKTISYTLVGTKYRRDFITWSLI